ncbi:MAG: DUF3500 domain-containing protein [Planctomycetota bacterium]|jgi:hypothetical protein|nr:DUF3500 domain-containing protein [Planctomycetota bacterium]
MLKLRFPSALTADSRVFGSTMNWSILPVVFGLAILAFEVVIPSTNAGETAARIRIDIEPLDAGSAGQAFLETLDEPQLQHAVGAINATDRGTWTYFPGPRVGLRLGELKPEQRAAFDRFLAAALSESGVRRVQDVLAIEPISDRGGGVRTGPGEYWIRFFGTPEPGRRSTEIHGGTTDAVPKAWAWRLEGHHLSLNVAIVDDRIVSATPFFFGAAPSRHTDFGEPLALDDARAERLLSSLDPIQQAAARSIGPAPADIRSGTEARPKMPREGGIKATLLSKEQRATLDAMVISLFDVWPAGMTTHLRERWMATDPETIRFAWAGSELRGGPHYWRVQSPALLMEFSNSSPAVDHAHLVLRAVEGEFFGR